MLSRRGWLRATPVIAQMMTTKTFLRCLHDDMMLRPIALVQRHLPRRLTPLFLLYLSG